jgi:hypothetical protein
VRDKAASGGTGNKWKVNGGNSCTFSLTTCASAINDDYLHPSLPVDYIVNGNSSAQTADFELTDAPANLGTATSIQVIYSAIHGASACHLAMSVYRDDHNSSTTTDPFVGSQGIDLGTSTANNSFTLTGLSLSASDVDDLYLRLANDVVNNACQVYYVNLIITYAATTP